MRLILRWFINALALLLIAQGVDGVTLSGWYPALITIVVLGLVNAVIRPLFVLLTLPITVLTLGLFTFVINGLLFWFVSTIVQGFQVAGFWPALVGSFILTLVSWIVSSLIYNHK
jgi:putative membrane protein